MKKVTTVVMTELFEKKFVECLKNSALHQRLSHAEQDSIGKINPASVAFMNAMAKRVEAQTHNHTTINDFRCFESEGVLIGALYDKAFITYPENFGNQLVSVEGCDGAFNMDGMSFGLIASMIVCRDLSIEYEKQGKWDKVLQVLEAYYATHDAFLAAGRAIDNVGDAVSITEHVLAHNFYIAFRTILRVLNKDGVSGTYDRLGKAREITSKPTLRMRILNILRVA